MVAMKESEKVKSSEIIDGCFTLPIVLHDFFRLLSSGGDGSSAEDWYTWHDYAVNCNQVFFQGHEKGGFGV